MSRSERTPHNLIVERSSLVARDPDNAPDLKRCQTYGPIASSDNRLSIRIPCGTAPEPLRVVKAPGSQAADPCSAPATARQARKPQPTVVEEDDILIILMSVFERSIGRRR